MIREKTTHLADSLASSAARSFRRGTVLLNAVAMILAFREIDRHVSFQATNDSHPPLMPLWPL